MSDSQLEATDAHDALAEAIQDNPEEVAKFVQRLGLVNELLDTTALATSALDDRMVSELTQTSSLLLESADGLATRETAHLAAQVGENAGDLESALQTVLRLERAGTLDELAELADAASLMTAALDDDMVVSLARTGSRLGEVADAAAEPEVANGLQTMLRAFGNAADPDDPPARVGALGMMKAMRDPQTQRGLGFVLALAQAIGSEFEPLDEQ